HEHESLINRHPEMADEHRSYLQQVHVLYHVFFFSSRRRHTRWPRDWSSDVCSSDLTAACARRGATRRSTPCAGAGSPARDRLSRSEERRVGKECRSRWWTYH